MTRPYPLRFRMAFDTKRPGFLPEELGEGEGAADGAIFMAFVREGDERQFVLTSADGSEPGRTPVTLSELFEATAYLASAVLGVEAQAKDMKDADPRKALPPWQRATLKAFLNNIRTASPRRR